MLHLKNEDIMIEVLTSNVPEFALMGFGSIKNCRSIYNALKKVYNNVLLTIIKNKSDLVNLVNRKPDLVFLGLKCVEFNSSDLLNDSVEKIWLSEYLDQAGINYTGSPKSAIELEYNKGSAKEKVKDFFIDTIPYFLAIPDSFGSDEELPIPYPLFIKPLCEGNSIGIDKSSVVYDYESYKEKVQNIYTKFNQSVLIEKFVIGREFTVAIMNSLEGNLEAMPVEIIVNDKNPLNRILGYDVKSNNTELVSTVDEKELNDSIISVAKKAFVALGGRDFGRIDIITDENNIPYFLEANLVPGMSKRFKESENSYFPRACYLNSKTIYNNTVLHIAKIALKRAAESIKSLEIKKDDSLLQNPI